jgi:hypothetical protein
MQLLREKGPLSVDPSLQFHRASEMHAVQEGAGVDLHGARQVALGQKSLELGAVGPYDVGVEEELKAFHPDRRPAQIPTGDVEELVQSVARVLVGTLRPEIGEEPVTGYTQLSGPGQKDEQGETSSLSGRCRDGGSHQGQPAEGLQKDHGDAPREVV